MYHRKLIKPDGRQMWLYGRHPISEEIVATSAAGGPLRPNPHLRWHRLRGEWVAYAAYRQDRAFLPPKEFNPLAPTRDPKSPTELPAGEYDVAAFENLSPALSRFASEPPPDAPAAAPARGACEVIVFSRDPETSLGRLPLWHIELILEVWAHRYVELGSRPEIRYVMPFENRGVEMGVTLHHPHGQLYAYPFVPPIPARENEREREHFAETGECLVPNLVDAELDDGRRVIFRGEHAAAFVPAFARYPYEVWIAPRRCIASLADVTNAERGDIARALKTVLLKYDGLWNRPFPYLMVLHQAPTDGRAHPESCLHFELYPPYRTRDRLKYLAGTELGAGMFASDTLPEEKAEELKRVRIHLE